MVMKGLSIEQKAEAYDEALEKAVIAHKDEDKHLKATIERIFPELKESEDEKIRKELLESFKYQQRESRTDKEWLNGIKLSEVVAWLEKQGEKSVEPKWCHHKVDLSDCSEEYRKAYYDGWNNCNMQHSQYKSESNVIVKCLLNGMKFYYEDNEEATWGTEKFSMKVKDIISWLEGQGEPNPYSGMSFEYNGHTWGMCARDGGVEILVDGEIKERVFLDNKPQGKSALEAIKEEKVDNQNCVKTADKVEPFDEYEGLTDFERTLADICIGWIGQELGWKQYIKDNADVLLKIAVEKFNSVQDVPFEQKPSDSYCQENCRGFQETGKCFTDGDCKAKREAESIDKIELKFREGEWIIWYNKCYKVNYNGCGYELIDQNGLSTHLEYGTIDESAHLWDVTKDAKDGDVLCDYCKELPNPLIFILKKFEHVDFGLAKKSDYSSYCFLKAGKEQEFQNGSYHHKHNIFPATKEQRDTLFSKMKEAGYEWDAEKLELKKIENTRPMLSDFFNAEYERGKADALNMEWSEEDKMMIEETLYFLREYQQSDRCKDESDMQNSVTCIDWLKSLKDRYTWKPSEEQMEAVKRASNGSRAIAGKDYLIMESLYNDLEKLTE